MSTTPDRADLAVAIATAAAAKLDAHTDPAQVTTQLLLCGCGRTFRRMGDFRKHYANTRAADFEIWSAVYDAALAALPPR